MPTGTFVMKKNRFRKDFRPIDEDCVCSTCKTYSRAYIHSIVTKETVGCHLLSVHNIAYQVREYC